jgi:Ligated ion channel L-glutamate- and glycine-binding site
VQEKPYVMVREDKNLTGNARYEGFCIDLLKAIANQVDFNYDIRLVPDDKYGAYDQETKEWNGIVRELMDKASIETLFSIHLTRMHAFAAKDEPSSLLPLIYNWIAEGCNLFISLPVIGKVFSQ